MSEPLRGSDAPHGRSAVAGGAGDEDTETEEHLMGAVRARREAGRWRGRVGFGKAAVAPERATAVYVVAVAMAAEGGGEGLGDGGGRGGWMWGVRVFLSSSY